MTLRKSVTRRWGLVLPLLVGVMWHPAANAQPAQQLVIAQGTDAVTMDPHYTTQMTAMQPFNFIYEKLLNRNDEMELIPELAESWKSVDDLNWEIQLKKGVKFHNGEDFNAEAVKFTLDRIRVPGSTPASGGFTTIEEIRIVDPYTVIIKTFRPDPLLPARLAQWGSQMLPPGYVKEVGAEGLALKGVGTGPYTLSEWRKDDRIVLEANPDHWGGKPELSTVIFRPIPDEFARVSALLAGEVDLVANIPIDFKEQIDTGSSTYVAETSAGATNVFIMGRDEPLQKREVRQALNLAIDREKLSETLFHGLARPISQGAAPTDFGFNPSVPPYPYDPEKARQLLAEAGYPDGFPLVVQSANGYILGDTLVVEAVVEMLKEVGIDAKLHVLEMARRTEMLGQRTVTGLLLINPGSTTFDADGIVWRLLHPDSVAGDYWQGSKKGSDFFELMETARYTIDQDVRQDLYYKAAEVLYNDPPWLYLWQEFFLYGTNCRLDFTPRVDTMILPSSVRIDEAGKGGGRCE